MEKSDSFASDVVKQVLKDYRRFIIILIVFIFVNNIAWLIAWNYPSIRGEQVQVESDGRYSEGNFRYSQDRGRNSYEYSRDDAAQMMRSRLESMANEPMSENNRLAIMDCLNKIK